MITNKNEHKSLFPDIEIPKDMSLPQFVMEDFKENGNKAALIDAVSGREITFQILYEGVHQMAAGFRKYGVKKGDVVIIFLPNVVEYPIILMGLQLFGAIPSTMNPVYTPDEISHQIEDSNALAVITLPSLVSKVQEASEILKKKIQIISLGQAEGAIPLSSLLVDLKVDYKYPKIDTSHIAVLPYSSGTTGKPKGVVLTHHNLISNTLQILSVDAGAILYSDRFVGILPFFHIYGMVWLLYVVLRSRCAIVVMPRFDMKLFLESIQKYKISIAHVAPPLILALFKETTLSQYNLSSLRWMYCGAAPLGGDLQVNLARKLGIVIKQGYGMTEMSPVSLTSHHSKVEAGSVGMLVPNCTAKIVDVETQQLVGVGKEGELWVKGPNIMMEYLNNKTATSSTVDSDGYLHSGDIVYVNKNGNYFVVDRLKELIKYKGYQVPPAELEAVLQMHPAVADAAVVGKPDDEGGELPTAFIVLKSNQSATADEIIQFAEQKLAPYKKLRGGVYFVEYIPKSPSGKILRRLLRSKL
eukprot:TRINITY_DN18084_c0_g1_i1.p1 TRINITY_DN18084_c0_g1~~TRINITY_DN18084_c0_g1_i1.p1  ORF type:complete len:527 (-),score=137.72 TRINITY_DN18084_c0_g1_i1:166-1746(-)